MAWVTAYNEASNFPGSICAPNIEMSLGEDELGAVNSDTPGISEKMLMFSGRET
jgi:hypothetical protein